jgi:hypothetical protein
MTNHTSTGDYFVDSNGFPAERVVIDGHDVTIHYRDIPESDITAVNGVPCTTPLRTVIDLAPQLGSDDLALMVRDCLDRGLFTLDHVWKRIAEPDMLSYPGATSLRQFLIDPDKRLHTG